MVESALSALGALVLIIWTAAGLRFYLPLAREVFVRNAGRVTVDWAGRIDIAVAVVLTLWFAMLGRDALLAEGQRTVEFRHVLAGAAVYASIVLFLAGSLICRNLPLSSVFGLDRYSFPGVLWRGGLALLAAYPVLLLVQVMVYSVAGGDLTPQDVVQFLQNAETPRDRIAVLVMAVAVAPVAEELIFRGYLYPVGKRHFGPFISMVATSLLFAVLHGHAASIPGLFALAMCLGLAYEKSGSLLVPMIMHAIFNAVSVLMILFLL